MSIKVVVTGKDGDVMMEVREYPGGYPGFSRGDNKFNMNINGITFQCRYHG